MKSWFIYTCAGVLALAAGLVLLYPLLESKLYLGDTPVHADAIIVLSGDREPDYMRTRKAVELYRRGFARYIIFTGYGSGGDSGEFLSKIAARHRIPRSAIIIEPDARTTYENFLFSRPIIERRGFTSIIIVTSPYHQLRAYLVAKKVFAGTGVALYNCASNPPGYREAGIRDRLREARYVITEYIKIFGYYLLGRIR